MRWREALRPVVMTRVALVVPESGIRQALLRVAEAGVMEIDQPPGDGGIGRPRAGTPPGAARVEPRLAAVPPDPDAPGRADLLAGEAELAGYAAGAVRRGTVAALLGWVPAPRLPRLRRRLAEVGAAVAPLPVPRGVDPPTLTRPGATREAFSPLVTTYGTPAYADLDPTVLAGLAYVVMFGAMFGDVGHGALLLLGGVLLRLARPVALVRRAGLVRFRRQWLFVAGAGLSSALFGLAYGECFGPTGLVPVLWLAPMEHPVPLLVAGIGFGAVLLAGAYLLGSVNRVREGGLALALYAPSGLAGTLLFLAAGLAALAWYAGLAVLSVVALVLAGLGLGLSYVGLLAGSGGGGAGVLQAVVELFDVVIRLGANVVSFARLAAFGLTHAVLGWIVWRATAGLWHRGPAGVVGAAAVFALGNGVAFALEALVAGVQALRLEYYELFSRVFGSQGRPFRPWRVAVDAGAGAGPDAGAHVGSPER